MNISIKSIPPPTGASVFTRKIQAGRSIQLDLQAYAHELHSKLTTPPPQQFDKPMKFKTQRQRRFVLASIREGSIQVPRRRTGNLGRGWTIVTRSASGAASYVIEVFNRIPYAPIVQGRRIYHPAAKDMRERGWKNWEATALGLLRKYSARMRSRIRAA